MLKDRRKRQRSSCSTGGQLCARAERGGSIGGMSKVKVKGHTLRLKVRWHPLAGIFFEFYFIHSNHISWYIEDHSFANTYIEHA